MIRGTTRYRFNHCNEKLYYTKHHTPEIQQRIDSYKDTVLDTIGDNYIPSNELNHAIPGTVVRSGLLTALTLYICPEPVAVLFPMFLTPIALINNDKYLLSLKLKEREKKLEVLLK